MQLDSHEDSSAAHEDSSAAQKVSADEKDIALLVKAVAVYVAKGEFAMADGHLPIAPLKIPADFSGICVASMADADSDERMIEYLEQLDLRQVRLDYTYGDNDGHTARFLEQLQAHSFRILLRLLPPPEEASRMEETVVAERWRTFVETTLERFGDGLEAVEIGNTVNRKNWSGFRRFSQFMAAWRIAHEIIRRRNLTIGGPNVTDFEPPFNKILLTKMAEEGCLPDIHTNNLFAERAVQPENYDHKILGRRLAGLHKLNLIKKARLLKRISDQYGIDKTWSTTAFWTLPRIGRRTLENEEAQADYLTRYMVLAAVSGALERAYWGPLVSQREGLVDDGTGRPAPHELVAFYGTNYGDLEDYRTRPAFHAFACFNRWIPGALYQGRKSTGRWLEIHEFETAEQRIHIAWTGDKHAAELAALYSEDDLDEAEYLSRDGAVLPERPSLITDSPVYLCWPLERTVSVTRGVDVLADVAIDGNRRGGNYYRYQDPQWRGVVFAPDREQADRLIEELHPHRIGAPTAENILRKARNVIWRLPDPLDPEQELTAKKPNTLKPHKRFLDKLKPSKAARSWNGATLMMRAGISSPEPIAYFESATESDPFNNWYICRYAAGMPSVRSCFEAYTRGETSYKGITREMLFPPLCAFLFKLHQVGVYFRDLASGNILIDRKADGELQFTLIDTARARFYPLETPLPARLSDLKRTCYKLSWPLRIEFMEMYLGRLRKPRRFSLLYRLPFHYFDFKTDAKRFLKGKKKVRRS